MTHTAPRSIAADAGAAATAYWFLDTLAVVHSATPPLVIEITIPVGGSPPRHIHDGLDDRSYLLDGALAVRCGGPRPPPRPPPPPPPPPRAPPPPPRPGAPPRPPPPRPPHARP